MANVYLETNDILLQNLRRESPLREGWEDVNTHRVEYLKLTKSKKIIKQTVICCFQNRRYK